MALKILLFLRARDAIGLVSICPSVDVRFIHFLLMQTLTALRGCRLRNLLRTGVEATRQ